MMRLLFLLVLFVLSFTPSGAQDAPRLRVAPPDEVLDTLIALGNEHNLSPMKGDELHLSGVVDAEFDALLHHPSIRLDTLLRTFQTFDDLNWLQHNYDEWGVRIIGAWLADERPDFAAQPAHTFGDFTVEASPLDFNADGAPEWALNVTTESGLYRQILVAGEVAGEFGVIRTELPWFGDGWGYYSLQAGFIEPQTFQDLTGGGKPEWVLALGGLGGGHQNFGSLYVLQWRGGTLENIADIHYSSPAGGGSPLFPYGVSLEYGETEVVVRQQRTDNWGCESEWVTAHRWNLATLRLEPIQPVVTVKESPGCTLRNAHVASWEGNHAEAVELYGAFLEEAAAQPDYQLTDYVLHAHLKRALAYATLGDSAAASGELEAAFNGLDAPELTDRAPIPGLVRAAHATYQDHPSALVLCAVLYSGFADYYELEPLPNNYWGIITYNIAAPGSAPRPDVARAGCDAPAMLAEAEDTPRTQLTADILRASQLVYIESEIRYALYYGVDYRLFSPSEAALEEMEALTPAYLNHRGQITLKDRLDMTRADLERFADDPRYGSVVRYQYAWALHDAGFDPDGAAAAYQAVIDHDPESPWARLAALKVE
jgi:hypothetical protein